MKIFASSDTFIFDLDRTIWDTVSKTGDPIWAKQMLCPYSAVNENRVVDDVFSVCTLHDGIQEFLENLAAKDKKIGFLSRGAAYEVPYEKQPSILLLKEFGIYDFFNYKKILVYKEKNKADYLHAIISDVRTCVFFDDMEKDLLAGQTVEGVIAVNRNSFKNWSLINE